MVLQVNCILKLGEKKFKQNMTTMPAIGEETQIKPK